MRPAATSVMVLTLAMGFAGCFGPGKAKVRPGDRDIVIADDKNVDDVIAREGPRDPSSDEYRRDWKMAMIILSKGGNPVSQASIDKVEKIRKKYEKFWEQQVQGQATLDTRLRTQ